MMPLGRDKETAVAGDEFEPAKLRGEIPALIDTRGSGAEPFAPGSVALHAALPGEREVLKDLSRL